MANGCQSSVPALVVPLRVRDPLSRESIPAVSEEVAVRTSRADADVRRSSPALQRFTNHVPDLGRRVSHLTGAE